MPFRITYWHLLISSVCMCSYKVILTFLPLLQYCLCIITVELPLSTSAVTNGLLSTVFLCYLSEIYKVSQKSLCTHTTNDKTLFLMFVN
jgi:hypothetical protein